MWKPKRGLRPPFLASSLLLLRFCCHWIISERAGLVDSTPRFHQKIQKRAFDQSRRLHALFVRRQHDFRRTFISLAKLR